MDFELSDKQLRFCASDRVETFFIGGVGSGKSFSLATTAYRALRQKGAVLGFYAPTTKVLKRSTLVAFEEAWNKFGFFQGVHYVVGKIPPWKHVKPHVLGSQDGILTTIFGSYAILDGLDNFNSQRGLQLDEIFVDEMRDVKPEARKALLARLRGPLYNSTGKKHRIWYATTPPDNPYFLQSLAENQTDEQEFVFGTSFDNLPNLPAGYLDTLASTLDSESYEREVLGKFVFVNGRRFTYEFDKNKHIGQFELTKRLPLYLSFDFNVSPATCIIGQHDDDQLRIFDEIRIKNTSIYGVTDEIKKRYPDYAYQVTGDVSGNAREKATRDLTNMYKIIAEELYINRSQIKVGKQNPTHHSNSTLVNSLLKNYDIIIHPQCKFLIQDLEMVQTDEAGKIDKSNPDLTHLLDCFRYYCNTWFSWFIPKR